GAYSREAADVAEQNTRSAPRSDASVVSSTVRSSPRKRSFLPAERAVASSFRLLSGKLRSSATRRNTSPTAPVAPITATLGRDFGMGGCPSAGSLRAKGRDPSQQGAAYCCFFVVVVTVVLVIARTGYTARRLWGGGSAPAIRGHPSGSGVRRSSAISAART